MAKALFGTGYVEIVCDTWDERDRVTATLSLFVTLGVLPESFGAVSSTSAPGSLFVGERDAIDRVMATRYKAHKARLRDVCPCGHPRSAHVTPAEGRKCVQATWRCEHAGCGCTCFDEEHRTTRAAS